MDSRLEITQIIQEDIRRFEKMFNNKTMQLNLLDFIIPCLVLLNYFLYSILYSEFSLKWILIPILILSAITYALKLRRDLKAIEMMIESLISVHREIVLEGINGTKSFYL